MTGVAALVLAAGRARRFGATADDSKVVADFAGMPLVRHVAMSALASRAAPVVVVTGHASATVEAALATLPIRVVRNPDHATGMASSLKAGLNALLPEATGVLILLADMPLVTSETLNRLIARFESEPSAIEAVIPVFKGRRGNPVLIGRALFEALGSLRGDQGARRLLAAPGRTVAFCPVDDSGIEIDVDTRDALAALLRANV